MATREEIEQDVVKAVAKALKRDADTITPDMRWVEDLNFKSVQGMKVCGLLNYKYGITIPLTDLIKCDTLTDAAVLIEGMLD